MITIKCFGIAREIVKSDTTTVASKSIKVKDLRKLLDDTYNTFTQIKGYMIAINQEYATDDQFINEDDEVAIIPPVSGG